MKEWIALITDQHFGARNNSQLFFDHFMKFYNNVFFPTLKEYGVYDVIDLGDTFDKRKSIDFNMLSQVKKNYYDVLDDNSITTHCIVGNHTAYFKNTNRVNTPDLLMKEYSTIQVYSEPTVVDIEGVEMLFLPWINDENKQQTFELLKQKHKYCFGHLEINGFSMYAGHVHKDGEFDVNLFSNIDHVFSGHFHHRSKKGNVQYLGNPYEITWSDFNDPRGFHLLNLKTGELKFIQNPHIIFHKLQYDESAETRKTFNKENLKKYKDCYVKVIVKEKKNVSNFEKSINNLMSNDPADVIVLENELSFDVEDHLGTMKIEEENTSDICKQSVQKYVKENQIDNGDELETKLLNLLNKAEMETT